MTGLHKSGFFILVLIYFSGTITAQVSSESLPRRPMNVVFMNVAGGATYISFEYERLFGRKRPIFISAGAGVGEAMETYPENYYMTLPFHGSINIGPRASFFELGVGRTLIFNHPDRNGISYLILGYRLALPKKNKIAFSLKINLNIPFDFYNVISEGNPQFIPVGVGLGIAF
jgi:hypothetical protein